MNVHIHIIEDDAGDAELIRAYLSCATSCRNATTWSRRLAEGMASLKEKSADVILLDLGLPDSLGLCTFRALHAKFASIPIIVLSGLNDQDTALTAVREGAQDYLVKGSFNEEDLCRAIRYALERKKVERALQAAEERYRSIFENAPVGIFRADKKGTLLAANEELATILGYDSSSDLIRSKNNLIDLFNMDAASLQNILNSMEDSDEIVNIEMQIERKDEAIIWISRSMRGVFDEINGSGYIDGFVENITDRKKHEIFREDVDRILRHDLKSPLTGIINLPCFILESDNLSQQQRHFLHLIEDNGRRMLRMITTSLKLFKMENGKFAIEKVPFDLLQLGNRVDETVRNKTLAKQSPVHFFLDGRIATSQDAFMVEGDESLCFSLLENLILNAQEAAQDNDPIVVTFDTASLSLHIRNKGRIPREIRAQHFEKYASFGKRGGTGLGLYSAKMISQAHGWLIALEEAGPDEVSFGIHFAPQATTSP